MATGVDIGAEVLPIMLVAVFILDGPGAGRGGRLGAGTSGFVLFDREVRDSIAK